MGRGMNTKEKDTADTENLDSNNVAQENCDDFLCGDKVNKNYLDTTEDQGAEDTLDCVEKTDAERITDLEKQNTDLTDQFLRKSADLENYRKRMLREKQDAFDYANTNLLTDLITVLDDFDRALAAGSDGDNYSVTDLEPVVDGIKIINKQMRGLLEVKYNLNSYGEKGDIFDHDKHEAIATQTGAVVEAICSEVYLKGYMLKERVVRPAKVMVLMPDGSMASEDLVSDGLGENESNM